MLAWRHALGESSIYRNTYQTSFHGLDTVFKPDKTQEVNLLYCMAPLLRSIMPDNQDKRFLLVNLSVEFQKQPGKHQSRGHMTGYCFLAAARPSCDHSRIYTMKHLQINLDIPSTASTTNLTPVKPLR